MTVTVDGQQKVPGPTVESTPPRQSAIGSWLVPVAIVAIGASFSLPRLGARTVWLDEAYTVGATTQLFDTWRNTAATQALYYLLIWPVTRLSTDPAWLRLPSALLGMAALVVVFQIGRRISGRREAILAAGGLALSWGLARYSVEARSYTLALLLVSATWLALVAAVQAGTAAVSRRWWRIYALVTLLVPLAHGLASLNFPVQLAALAIAPGDRRSLLRRALVVGPALILELAALFLLGAADVGDWVAPLSLGQLRGMQQLMLGFGAGGIVLSCITAAGVVVAMRRFWRERSLDTWMRLLPVFWAFGPPVMVVLVSLFRPYAAARYVFASIPGFFLLLAGPVARLGSPRRVAAASLAIALLLVGDQQFVTTAGIEDWRELTTCIASNSVPGDRLISPISYRPPLDYYWPEHPELTEVETLSPVEPMGEVRRLYESRVPNREAFRATVLENTTESIWYVDRGPWAPWAIFSLAADDVITAHFDFTDPPWHFRGGLLMVRLDPRGTDRPRGVTPCETVGPPARDG